MTALRAALVNSITLSEVANGLNIGDFCSFQRRSQKLGQSEANIFWPTLLRPLSGLCILSMDTKNFWLLEKTLFGKIEEVIEKNYG